MNIEYNSDNDSDYTPSDACSDCTEYDSKDDVPFFCEKCNKIFKRLDWYTKHMQHGVHKAPAVGMQEFVARRMQFHVAQSKQVTSMHFKNGEG